MKKLVNRLLLALVVLLPWHTLIINGYLRKYFSPIVMWKELVVVVLFILALSHKGSKISGIKWIVLLSTLFLLTAHFIFNGVGMLGAPSYRIYVLPILLIISLFKLSDLVEWNQLVKWFVIGAFVMAIFSTIQQLFLGPAIYLKAGYQTNAFSDDKLNFTFYIGYGLLQRAAGGFVGPIPYSLYVVLSLVLLYKNKELFTPKFNKALNMVLTISLVLTFVRSSIGGYLLFFLLPYSNFFNTKTLKYLLVMLTVLVVQFFVVPDDVQELELGTINTFYNNSTSLDDTSSAGHFESLERGFKLAWDNIGTGVGLGRVGAQTAAYIDNPLSIESGYLSVIIELGLLTAGFIYCSFLLIHYQRGSLSTVIILIYLATSFLLPIIYYVELSLLVVIAIETLNKDKNHVNNRRKSMAGSFSEELHS